MVEIQDYDFSIEYAPGRTMAVVDALSRDAVGSPCPRCTEQVRRIEEDSTDDQQQMG